MVLVNGPPFDARQEALPDARLLDLAKGMRVLLPPVEVADDRDRGGVGREDREGRPRDAVHRPRMGSEPLPKARVRSLIEEVKVVGAEERGAVDRRAGARDRTGASFLRQKDLPSRQFTPEAEAAIRRIKCNAMDGTAIVICDGSFRPRAGRPRTASSAAPTATASSRSSTCPTAGRDAGEVLDGVRRGIPVYASIAAALEALASTPDFCIVGVATSGGRVTPGLRALLFEAIDAGMSVVNGLHEFLGDDPALAAAAERKGVTIRDVRRTARRTDLHFWEGRILTVGAPRIAVLGTDCALGKRTTARFLLEACRAAGIRTELVFTGQTGWMQGAPFGFIFDSVPNDFVSGELEHAIVSCWGGRRGPSSSCSRASRRCAIPRARAAPSSSSRAGPPA